MIARLCKLIVFGYAVVQIGPSLWEAGLTACVVGGVVLLAMVNPS